MSADKQPGDREDVEGHPFVGPAGGVLDRGLEQAGIVRAEVFVTNMVKHIAELVTLTSHPSSILRERDDAARRAAIDAFVADLAQVAQWLN
jgi:uracil-DNA glycosylase